jgi:thioredoxin-like negative regulator of GroEL
MLGALIFMALGFAAAGAPVDVRWETRLDRATAMSRETNKPVLIEFWATWCTVCKGMDAEVYSDPAVVDAMRKVLPVRIDIDREQAIARRYGVADTPTLMLTDASGNELFRFKGGLPRDRMLGLLHDLPADIGRINQLARTIAAGSAGAAVLGDMGRELHDAALYVASNRYYERALRAKDVQRDPAAGGAILEAIARNYDALGVPAEAARARERAKRALARSVGN